VSSLFSDNSIRDEILSYDDSSIEIIAKGRSLIIENFRADNFEKVRLIKTYLESDKVGGYQQAFYLYEKIMLAFWLEDYEYLLPYLNKFFSLRFNHSERLKPPHRDELSEEIRDKSCENKDFLISSILKSDLSSVDKDFLLLCLLYVLKDDYYTNVTQNDLNVVCERFLNNYPNSEYLSIIKETIRVKYVKSDFGLDNEFFVGYGHFEGDISKLYKNQGVFGWDFAFNYKKYFVHLRINHGITKTKEDISVPSGIYEKGSVAGLLDYELSFGYNVLENRVIKLSPFVGIATIEIEPYIEEEQDDSIKSEIKIEMSETFVCGLNLDFKIWSRYYKDTTNKIQHSYWFIRLHYGYNYSTISNEYYDATGNVHHLTLGLGYSYGGVKRSFK
jgi:hypothetical protein